MFLRRILQQRAHLSEQEKQFCRRMIKQWHDRRNETVEMMYEYEGNGQFIYEWLAKERDKCNYSIDKYTSLVKN